MGLIYCYLHMIIIINDSSRVMGRLHCMVQSGLGPWSNNRLGYPDLMSESNRAVPDPTRKTFVVAVP